MCHPFASKHRMYVMYFLYNSCSVGRYAARKNVTIRSN